MTRCVVMLAVLAGLWAAAEKEAQACIRAAEANTLVGWSEDGKYALYTLVTDGKIEHAEILPTTYSGHLYTVTEDEGRITVARAKVGSCAEWGDSEDPKTVVEKKKGKLTDKALMELKTVAAMKFGRVESTANTGLRTTAVFTGKKRYDVHNVEITRGADKLEVALPVYCVGSCFADEKWKKWTVNVEGVHTLADGTILYELKMANVCNGGTIRRLVAPTPATTKVPKRRCTGSGQ